MCTKALNAIEQLCINIIVALYQQQHHVSEDRRAVAIKMDFGKNYNI